MEKKTASAITLTLLLIGMLTLAFNIQTAKAESELQIIIGTTDSVEGTLDPAQAYDYFGWCILQQIAGTLVSVKPGSTTGAEFVPELAESWNVSDDSTIWDFTLRQGITFPDGTEFNATHVKYSFDRVITLIPSIPEGAPAGLGYDLIINRIEVLSTYKVRFYLNFPFSPLLGILACRASAIVDPRYAPIAQVNYTAGDPRASTSVAFIGPYNLSRWERVAGRDVEIKLDANPHYWNATSGYPKIKHIIFRFYSNSSSLRSAIDTGDVDMAFRHISPTDVLDLEDDPSVKVWWGTGAFIQYLCFQEKRAPFNDTRARVAVAAALNRSIVCQTVFLGLASPLYSIIPPGMLGHTEAFTELGDANYTLTRSLLAELGYNEANKLTFDLWYESSGHYPMSGEQALMYKEAFEASGVIQVTLKSADWPSYRANRNDEIMDAYVYGWYPDYVDPDDYSFLYWATWLHTNYDSVNPVTYAQQVALYDDARATTNLTLRAELYAQIDDIAIEQCSVVPLYVDMSCAVTKPNIHGVCLDITQDMRYWLLYIAEAEPRTWTVDDDGPADFHTIGEAVAAAGLGDTIYVRNGTYNEHVAIYSKTDLRIFGEDRSNTIIDGNGYGPVVTIANGFNVTFANFTVRNAGWTSWERDNGIRLYHTVSSQVADCIVSGGAYGIREMTEWGEGGKNVINGNMVSDCTEVSIGSSHAYSIDDIVSNNTIANSTNFGIYFNNPYNIQIVGNHVFGTESQHSQYGIHLQVGGLNNTIIGNRIEYSDNAIRLDYADSNVVEENAVENCTYGVFVGYESSDNIVAGNNASGSSIGFMLWDKSNDNLVANNLATNNGYGIALLSSNSNKIYHNNFISNNQQVLNLDGQPNVWDGDYPLGGNYWSDYAGVDANGDGIGDTSYVIDADNQDRYPLMHPWSSLPVHNINTGLGYATIQEAINANETLDGHKIFVEAGTYFENVNINKSLTFIGEDRSSTIVDGNLTGTVVHVSADNVIITGFTIQNGGTEEGNGIELSSDLNLINGNLIAGNAIGIYVYKSHNNTVQNTELMNNVCGVAFDWADHNVFEENEVVNNVYGIALTDRSDYITVKENHVSLNDYGVYLEHSWHNNITGNAIANSTNTGIYISKSSENTVSRNTIANNRNGILLSFSNFEIVSKNIVSNNYFGILLSGSSHNSIMGNDILNNYVGVFLEYTDLNESTGNAIVGNTISNNEYGVGIEECSGNTVYHNNFINNTMHAGISPPHANTWDDGYPSGGNHWSGYVGADVKSGPNQDLPGSDGICDTPYIINADNVDHYPLVNLYGAPPPPTYALTITATVGGTTEPAPGIYGYTANSQVQVTAIPEANYLFDYWELDSVNVGSANPCSVYMDKDHTLKTVFSPIPPPLSASISPLSTSILAGQSVTFTSTVSGGYTPYNYQWYLNGALVSGANASSWAFTSTTSGIYYIYLKVTDAKGNATQSETARITAATVPVGGYSIPIQSHTVARPSSIYLAIMAILTAAFTTVKRKTHKRRK